MPIQGLEFLLQRREAIVGELQEIDRLIAMLKIDTQPEIFRKLLKGIYNQTDWWYSAEGGASWHIDGIRIAQGEEFYDMWVTRARILLDARFLFYSEDTSFSVTETGKEFMNAI